MLDKLFHQYLERQARKASRKGDHIKAAELWVRCAEYRSRHPKWLPPYNQYSYAANQYYKAKSWDRCIDIFVNKIRMVATPEPHVIKVVVKSYLNLGDYTGAFELLEDLLQKTLDRGFDFTDWIWAQMLHVAKEALGQKYYGVLWPKKLCDRFIEVYRSGSDDYLSMTDLIDYLENVRREDLAKTMKGWRP